ncbi:hypothetical protein ACHAPT_008699 [Fusarium lateritium]
MSLKGQYRHITLRHERHLLSNTTPSLAPGEAKFSSYFLPSLPAGDYSIKIEQTVQAKKGGPKKSADPALRSFEVLAPEWAISAATNNNSDDDSAAVLSVFPASGQTAPTFRTLPHMVLKDAQLPWVRNVSEVKKDDINSVPWFALVVFSADELTLSEELGTAYFGKAGGSLNETLGWDLVASDIKEVKDSRVANLIPRPSEPDKVAKTRTSVIPVPTRVFEKLFTSEDSPSMFDLTPFRFMSHVREVSTAGTMSAATAVNDGDPSKSGTQTVSIVVSHRLGPTDIQVPTPVLAHLVSLQGIEGKGLNDIKDKVHVLMTSLFSWTYTAMPPGSPDVVSMLQHLGKEGAGLSVLRTDATVDVDESDSDVGKIVTKRQNDGYTLTRHRTVTGEQTAAIYRGPLTPTRVPYPLHKQVSFQSNFGTDLQILDPVLGMMDLSYSSAWQLGKTMAMGDPAFTTALSRLRTQVHRDSLESARKDVVARLRGGIGNNGTGEEEEAKLSFLSDTNPRVCYMPRNEIKADVSKLVKALNGINKSVHETGTAFSTNRWRRRDPSLLPSTSAEVQSEADLLSLQSEHVYPQMPLHSLSHLHKEATTPDGGVYNSHKIPNNTDYAAVQEWVLDRLHLAGIPAHYLLPDPSHIPPESLRFFHIDANWLDAMVDGALSLANHLSNTPNEDCIRTSLKETLNRYFKTPLVGDYRQQIPAYGFILRSDLLVQFPDLAVGAEFTEDEAHSKEDWVHVKPKAPILVQRRLAPDMMLVLLDREPPKLSSVTFSLPAHQQTFIAAFGLNREKADVRGKRIYATGTDKALPEPVEAKRREPLDIPETENPYATSQLFDWDARVLKIEPYAKLVHKNLWDYMPRKRGDYDAPGATAAVFALQLNEPVYTLAITAEKPKPSDPTLNGEDLNSWHILHEPKSFQFYPPPFPNAGVMNKPLPVSREAPTFAPTLLALPEAPSEQRHVSAILREPDIPVHPTDQPRFHFNIFRLGHPDSTTIATNADTPFDLVFSIRRGKYTTPGAWPMRIMHFDLVVPIADPSKPRPAPDNDWTLRALLRSDMPDGPAPVMLSNLRYNVLVEKWDVPGKKLHLSIVPRTKWGVHIGETVEASFLFPVAQIFPWDVPKGMKYPGQVELTAYMIADTDPERKVIEYKYEDDGKFNLMSERLKQ